MMCQARPAPSGMRSYFLASAFSSRSRVTCTSARESLICVSEGTVEAVARPLHIGRRFVVIETDLFDGRGKRVARVTQTQAVLAGS